MNRYEEAWRDTISGRVESLYGQKDINEEDVEFLTHTQCLYARLAHTLETGLSMMGLLMSHCECETLTNEEVRDLGHFIAAMVPTNQMLRENASLAKDVLLKHGLYEA